MIILLKKFTKQLQKEKLEYENLIKVNFKKIFINLFFNKEREEKEKIIEQLEMNINNYISNIKEEKVFFQKLKEEKLFLEQVF